MGRKQSKAEYELGLARTQDKWDELDKLAKSSKSEAAMDIGPFDDGTVLVIRSRGKTKRTAQIIWPQNDDDPPNGRAEVE